ncbi:cysteine desulfurase family protein [Antrihabitans sp. YC2-6]|uniref:cysteine desulfurase family protein n=1 Tax=Antrihabitans sp. YC2-6 TaxID=2799498 RepID=UPI0018F31C2D|nr:cysteine desulfurase family protein [Antrihabitans sp. YC2-6]MBJ8343445.1 cysteine desulfurase [Antrihabitans sp. YC2-6]
MNSVNQGSAGKGVAVNGSAVNGSLLNGAATPVYLDHAATTPMLPVAIEAMTAVFATVGNASSLHGSGRAARRRVEEARESIAACLGARPSEVIFTSGGTESDNLAVKGIYWARRAADPRRTRIFASCVEHHAVLDAVEWLERHEGASVTWLPVDAQGRVAPDTLRAALALHADDAALVTIMWANNEVGTIMPIVELAAIAREFGVPMHSDAIQAAAQLPIDFAASGLSAASIAAHKFGGPQGVGALLLGRQVPCVPLLHGGGHERDVRSGTPDTAAVAGMAAALRATVDELDVRPAHLRALREHLSAGVRATAPDAVLNGASGDDRLPGNAHFTFPGCEGDSLLMLLDAAGIECSTGSACTAGVARPSHVLIAMGVDPAAARGSLRFSLGHTTTRSDIDALIAALPQVVERAKAAGLAGAGSRSTAALSELSSEGIR